MPGHVIRVMPKLLGAIAEATAPEDGGGRRTLSMVVFDRYEIVACNGHIAVRYRFDGALDASFPKFGVSRSHVEAIAAATPRALGLEVRPVDGGRRPEVSFSLPDNRGVEGLRFIAPRLDAKEYPPLDVVIPPPPADPAPPGGIAFDARYLDLIYRIAKYADFESSVRVVSWGSGKRDSVMFEAGPNRGADNLRVAALRFVLMPVAHTDDPAESLAGAIQR